MRDGYRVSAELVRYHQTGVGVPSTDLAPAPSMVTAPGASFEFLWSPILMERPDGTRYAIWLEWSRVRAPGFAQEQAHGTVESPDGAVEHIVGIAPDLSYDPANRRLRGGRITCTLADRTTRPLEIEAISDTGFHLGAGLYFGFDGHHHGEWRGDLHVDGEHITDCSTAENARRLHQIRDTVIRVVDPVGGGEGWGNCQPIITGDHPDLGLSGDTSFM